MSVIEGFLGADAEIKISKKGKQYIRFSVRDDDGWISCMDFDLSVDHTDFRKGMKVCARGEIKEGEWQGKPTRSMFVKEIGLVR